MFEPKNNPQKRVTLRELVADHQVFAPLHLGRFQRPRS